MTSSQHVKGRPKPPKEVNKGECPVCGAKHGQTCFRLTATSLVEFSKTHRTRQREAAAAPKRRK